MALNTTLEGTVIGKKIKEAKGEWQYKESKPIKVEEQLAEDLKASSQKLLEEIDKLNTNDLNNKPTFLSETSSRMENGDGINYDNQLVSEYNNDQIQNENAEFLVSDKASLTKQTSVIEPDYKEKLEKEKKDVNEQISNIRKNENKYEKLISEKKDKKLNRKEQKFITDYKRDKKEIDQLLIKLLDRSIEIKKILDILNSITSKDPVVIPDNYTLQNTNSFITNGKAINDTKEQSYDFIIPLTTNSIANSKVNNKSSKIAKIASTYTNVFRKFNLLAKFNNKLADDKHNEKENHFSR